MLSVRLSRVGCSAAALVVAATSAIVLQATPAVAAPVACATASAEVVPNDVPPVGWIENLAFDRSGDLWVARSYRSVLERHDPSGRLTATVPIPFPSAVRVGPDGLLYVNSTPSPLDATVRSGRIVTVDPATAQVNPTPFATGLGLANGATIDSAGYHYIADTARGVTRIRPDGTVDEEWTAKAPKGIGYNGIAVRGDSLYVTMLFSTTTRVVRVPVSNPEQSSVAADLISTPGFLPPLFPDDLAASPDGNLYVSTGSGQLVRVNPDTHQQCTVLSTVPLTSVAVAPDSDRVLYVGAETGQLLRVRLAD